MAIKCNVMIKMDFLWMANVLIMLLTTQEISIKGRKFINLSCSKDHISWMDKMIHAFYFDGCFVIIWFSKLQ